MGKLKWAYQCMPKGIRCPRRHIGATNLGEFLMASQNHREGCPRDIPAGMPLSMFPSVAPKLIFCENTVQSKRISMYLGGICHNKQDLADWDQMQGMGWEWGQLQSRSLTRERTQIYPSRWFRDSIRNTPRLVAPTCPLGQWACMRGPRDCTCSCGK